jgi:HlyD family secretion protein
MKKLLVSAVVLAALGIGAKMLVDWRNQPPTVAFVRATRGPIASEVSTNGKVDPGESAPALAETAGRVSQIFVKLRQQVEAGAPLVELDTGLLKHELETIEAQRAGIRSDLDVLLSGGRQSDKVALQSQLGPLEVELRSAREELERDKRLEKQGGSTRQAVQERQARVDSLQAQIGSLNQRIAAMVSITDRGPLEAKLRELDVARSQTQSRIAQSTIRAPISGTVFQFDLKPGAYLNPGDTVATIGRLDRVRVLVYVDEPDLGRVHTGLPVTITWDAMGGRTWTGTVDRLPTQIQPLDSRQVGEVICLINNPNRDLLPGANISARIRTDVAEDAVTIPKEAIFPRGPQAGVYVLSGNKIEWRAVTQGINNVTRLQIKNLQEGDAVARPTEGVTLTSGMLVTPVFPE